LGGTNDLGTRVPVKTIIDNVKQLHRLVLTNAQSNIKDSIVYSIAVTVPQASWTIHSEERFQVNRAIRELQTRCSARMGLLDLENTFNQSDKQNHKYWSPDFLHFSPAGYDEIGGMLHKVMSEFTIKNNQEFSLSCLD
jgi:lysophospholipase L1-like esterase